LGSIDLSLVSAQDGDRLLLRPRNLSL
jgi:hypothetical protein